MSLPQTSSPRAPEPFRENLRGFWILTGATVISRLGDQMLLFALPLAVLQTTGSPGLAVLTFAMRGVPHVVSPLLGAVIDRFDRKRLYIAVQLFQAVCIGLITLTINSTGTVMILMALSGLGGVTAGLLGYYVLIPELVKPERRQVAVSNYTALNEVAKIGGPVVAGVVVLAAGPVLAIAIDAGTFVVAAFAAIALPSHDGGRRRAQGSGLADMFVGFSWVRRHPTLIALIATATVSNLGVGSLDSILVANLAGSQGLSAGSIGAIVTVGAVSGAAGAWAAARIFQRHSVESQILRWQLLVAVGAVLLMIPMVIVQVVAYCLLNLGLGGSNVNTISLRQGTVPTELTGRVNSVVRMFISGAVPVSAMVYASLTGWMPGSQWIQVAGLSVAGLAIWVGFLATRGKVKKGKS